MTASPDSQSYTVKDVARLVSPSRKAADVDRLIRQIRHWTACDLLTTIGEKNTGTGRSRLYDAHQVRKAAILAELARYGLNVGELGTFGEWADVLTTHEGWVDAIAGKRDVYLQMAWNIEGGASWSISAGTPNLFALKTDHFKSGKATLLDGGTLEIPAQDFTTAIVINVTKIFRGIRL